ncbi:MAG: DNA-binding protein [Oscillospiraceae bacterium]|nr:DNA-binding protein [Oscillospiraceae bacterium]
MDFLDELKIEDLNTEQREIADTLGGIEIYKNFIRNFGGSNVYAVLPETLTIEVRNRHIRKEFNGYNYKELARKYRISEISVRRVINEKTKGRKL